MVCDNLSFSGEIKLSRKHTRYIMRDLPRLTDRAIYKLKDRWHLQDQRIDAYKNYNLTDRHAHDLVIQSLDRGACTSTQIPKILKEWREPTYEEFSPRNAWSLFNAFTEVHKGNSLTVLPQRTEALHTLMDYSVGLN